MYLVLLETSGNQRYIFSSNRLRENVGASELVFCAGTQFVFKAVARALASRGHRWCGPDGAPSAREIRSFLRDPGGNPPAGSPGWSGVEFIQATSGKALLLVEDRDTAEAIVREATSLALTSAPGLDLTGVISREFDFHGEGIKDIHRQVHTRLPLVRQARPAPEHRFLRLPVVQECTTSGLPANGVDRREGPVSVVTSRKIEASENGWKRMTQTAAPRRLFDDLNDLEAVLEDDASWVALIHADGNGFGQVFTNFGSHLSRHEGDWHSYNLQYVKDLREFSLALEEATEEAFRHALKEIPEVPVSDNGRKADDCPVIPLVLGGDDVTVICDARIAFPFINTFLRAFEEETKARKICSLVTGWSNLSMAAGMAIVKPHFPFHLAYELAQQLLRSAKQVKQWGQQPPAPSAFDFHVLHDTSAADLETIRTRLTRNEDGVRLYGGPYVLGDLPAGLGNRSWQRFRQRICAILRRDEETGRRCLPASQLHWLREGLFHCSDEADRRVRAILPRYADKGLRDLLEDGESLFWDEDGRRVTGFLDAMEAAGVWCDACADTAVPTQGQGMAPAEGGAAS